MALYLDSANPDDIRQARELGFVFGVTTNPALIAAAGRPGPDLLRDILEMSSGPVFYQVTAESAAERARQAHDIFALAPDRLIVKIPATTGNIALAGALAADGLACCVTAVASAAQAYLAGLARVAYVAPYVNRLTRQLGDGITVVREIAGVLAGTDTRIIAASLKTPAEVVAALLAGAHDVTLPLDVIRAMGEHESSQQAIADFAAAAAQERP